MDNSSIAWLCDSWPSRSLIALSIVPHDFVLMSLLWHILDPLLLRNFMQTTSPLILTTLRTAFCLVQTLMMWQIYLSLVTTFSMPTSCCLVAVLWQSCVTAHKRDNADNPVGLVDTNPILDTQSYIIDFADGNQAMLTANLIVEPFYSQYDPDRNQMSSWTGLLTTDNSTMLLNTQTRSRYTLTAVLTLDVPP